jgi:hypothetical protein
MMDGMRSVPEVRRGARVAVMAGGVTDGLVAAVTRSPGVRWLLVAVTAVCNVSLLFAPYEATADRTAWWAIAGCLAVTALIVLEHRHPRLPIRGLVLAGLALYVLAVLMPPRQSNDVASYAMYGRMVAVHHVSPFTHVPAEFPHDPYEPKVTEGWRIIGSVYGPAFAAPAAVVQLFARGSMLASRLGYQAMAAVSLGAVGWLFARRRLSAPLVAIALHPIAVVSVVNGGHADAMVGAGLVLAVVMLERRARPEAVGALVGLVCLVKISALLPLGALALWLLVRSGRTAAARFALAGGGLVAGGYLAVGGLPALKPVFTASHFVSRASVFNAIASDQAEGKVRIELLVLFVAVPTVLAVAARLREHPGLVVAASMAPFLFGAPYVLAWYFIWLLPLGLAYRRDIGLSVLILIDTALLIAAYRYQVVHFRDELDNALLGTVFLTQTFQLVALAVIVVDALHRLKAYGLRVREPAPVPAAAPGGG